MTDRYADQTVLVTGGAQGLGLAMVRRFANEGAAVHVADLNSTTLGKLTSETVEGNGRIIPHLVDVSNSQEVDQWVDGVIETEGSIEAFVNNAGIIRDNRIEGISDSDWDAVITVNLTASFYGVRAVMPHMKAQKYGRIVSFSSCPQRHHRQRHRPGSDRDTHARVDERTSA